SHDANNFWDYGKAAHVPIESRRPGDLISWPGHIAIYIGNDQVIDAYPGAGVSQRSMWSHGTPRGCIRLYQ
ncbi:MAG: C40 family peptidase, partial [Atopobiaceae bacterium]|nr:C40 family peptidase [Atopobiaceae bacterium]